MKLHPPAEIQLSALGSGSIDQSYKMTIASTATADKKAFGHLIIACGDAPPILEAARRDQGAIAAFGRFRSGSFADLEKVDIHATTLWQAKRLWSVAMAEAI